MLTREITPEDIEEMKGIYEEKRGELTPNRKTGKEIDAYLRSKYYVTEITSDEAKAVVTYNIMNNEPLREKLPSGAMPCPVCYYVGDKDVFVGIDLLSGYVTVEGSEELYDELIAYRGLDEKDLKNYFTVAEYVKCAGV